MPGNMPRDKASTQTEPGQPTHPHGPDRGEGSRWCKTEPCIACLADSERSLNSSPKRKRESPEG